MAEARAVILAGDIGGTRTRLGSFDADGERPRLRRFALYPSREVRGLAEVVTRFLAEEATAFSAACFGIAGPVRDGRVETSNLPWRIEGRELAAILGLDAVTLLNDLEANAHALPLLGPDDLVLLSAGEPDPTGTLGLVSAGTGLGEAGLVWDGARHRPFASEGGHADFAPRSRLEIDLLVWLQRQFGHASVERVLSGPGLHNLLRFLVDTGRGEAPAWLEVEMEQGDPAAAIARAALEKRVPVCELALETLVSVYGAEAGNLALKLLATGGVYLGGGIAPRILPALREPRFLAAFHDKGRMRGLLEKIPVAVIRNEQAALLGAARVGLFGR